MKRRKLTDEELSRVLSEAALAPGWDYVEHFLADAEIKVSVPDDHDVLSGHLLRRLVSLGLA